MSSPGTLPTVITASGLQPQTPASLLAQLIALVSATNPGYTATLPGSLIEDISSTDVGALVLCDQARVELVNSLTPFASNPFLTNMLGQIYGVMLGAATNTSVFVVFTGPPGFTLAVGFTVSDGTYQYVVKDGGIIQSDGNTGPLFAVATIAGSWSVAAGSVANLVTSVPSGIDLSVVNPAPGTPASTAETEEDYRAACLQAGLAASQGMPRYLKTLLGNVSGVQSRLIAVRQQTSPVAGYEVICGGGDPYAVANAIFNALFFIPGLVGSTINVTGITQATLGVVTTDLNHGLITGQTNVHIAGVVGMTAANGGPYTVTVATEKTFTFGVNTSGFGAYVSGGVITPNSRNIVVAINDYPDTYDIPFVNPPEQAVAINVVWNTTATNFVSATAVAQLAAQPLVDYINSIPVGAPINVLTLDSTFRAAVSSALPPELVTRLVFTVSINTVTTAVTSGTTIISGDPESYFFTALTSITVTQA